PHWRAFCGAEAAEWTTFIGSLMAD
ncbi:MAG: hypothetical protein K0S35_3182, partial [Geminicoccaceae bacterium]|nr:hypothetical protein [Geminicoccaceae bacterium]